MIQNIIATTAISAFLAFVIMYWYSNNYKKSILFLAIAYIILAGGQAWHVRDYHKSLEIMELKIDERDNCG